MLQEIKAAQQRIAGVVTKTPLTFSKNLSARLGANIYLKREDMQMVRSFKIRGAYNKMSSMSKEELMNGIICASAGNHAQGVAFACAALSVKGVIFMPTTTPKQKISKVRHFGGDWVEIILHGDTYDDTQSAAYAKAAQTKAPFIHPFNDELVIAGQGTIGAEILDEIEVPVDYILVAVGGGGLISGVGSYFKEVSPYTKVIAIESEGASAFHQSRKAGQRLTLTHIDSFADGIAVKSLGDITYDIANQVTDDSILVAEGKICSTILSLYNDEAIVVEPAGAVGIAALDQMKDQLQGKNVVVIVCGGNNDITRTEDIRERALLWENKKHYFIVRFPQRAGALKEFLHVLGPDDDIAHFQYTKKNNRDSGPALVGIELKSQEDFQPLLDRMNAKNINFEHINNNPMLFEMLV